MNRPRVPCGTRGLCRSDARVRALEVCYQRLSATDAVGGGTHDAAGISGTLAARVKARGRHGVACSIADDRNRGARTRLHASEDRIGAVIATQFLTEQGNSQTKRFDDMLREGIVDRRPGHAKWIGWFYLSGCRAGAPRKEISDELCRRVPVRATQAIGGSLAGALELNACERIIAGKVVGCDVDE